MTTRDHQETRNKKLEQKKQKTKTEKKKADVSHALKQVGWCATRVTPEDWNIEREPSLLYIIVLGTDTDVDS